MFPINWFKQLDAPFFRRSLATRRHVRFKPELEIFEARIVPSSPDALGAALAHSQAAQIALREGVQAYVDFGRVLIDLTRIRIDQEILGSPLASDLDVSTETIENDQFTFGLDLRQLGIDVKQYVNALEVLIGVPGSFLSPNPSPPPAPRPSPTPTIIGTYSASLVPSDVIGDPDETSSRTVKVSFNQDGSGSLYISSFQGKAVSLSFPAGTAQYDSSGKLVSGIHYAINSDWSIDIGVSDVANKGQQIVADIDYVSQNTPDGIFFISGTLNRQ